MAADETGESPTGLQQLMLFRHWRKALSAPTARALKRCHAIEVQPGRFYALLSLGEAESLRALVHRRRDLSGFQLALRLLRRDPLGLSVLDSTKGWKAADFRWREARLSQCLLFLSGEAHYTQGALDALWRQFRERNPAVLLGNSSAEVTSGEALRDFFAAAMTLRRRSLQEVNSWKEAARFRAGQAPVAQLFVEPRFFSRRQRERLLGQAYQRLLDAGLPPEVAFNKLDSDADGELAAADFAAAGRVGITMPAELLLRLFETVDTARRGLISLEANTYFFKGFAVSRTVCLAAVADNQGNPDLLNVKLQAMMFEMGLRKSHSAGLR
eukprot:s5254_g6.t1